MVRLDKEETEASEQLREAEARIARIRESNLQLLLSQIRELATSSSEYSEKIGSSKSGLLARKGEQEEAVRERKKLELRSQSHALRQSEEWRRLNCYLTSRRLLSVFRLKLSVR